MSSQRPVPLRRRDIMKPSQLIGLSVAAGLFAGFVALMAMGFFEDREAAFRGRILVIALIAGGSTFLGTMLVIGLLLMMVHPEEITQVIDKPTLIEEDTVIAELKAQREATDAAKAAARARRAAGQGSASRTGAAGAASGAGGTAGAGGVAAPADATGSGGAAGTRGDAGTPATHGDAAPRT